MHQAKKASISNAHRKKLVSYRYLKPGVAGKGNKSPPYFIECVETAMSLVSDGTSNGTILPGVLCVCNKPGCNDDGVERLADRMAQSAGLTWIQRDGGEFTLYSVVGAIITTYYLMWGPRD